MLDFEANRLFEAERLSNRSVNTAVLLVMAMD